MNQVRIRGGGIIASNGKKNGKKNGKHRGKVSFRTNEVREIGRSLATLGLVKIKKGDRLNVRRRESLRRALAEAGEPLRWSEVAALSPNPVDVAAGDVKKLVRSGARSINRTVLDELADKKAEVRRLKKLIKDLEKLAEDKGTEYPVEIEYTRTAKSPGAGFTEKVETLELESAEDAVKAAKKIEKSLPNWTKARDEVIDELKRKQDTIKELTGNLSDLVDSWRGVLKEVLVTMR